MEKEKAEEEYDDAVAAGHTAVKMNVDKKLPDVIELNIGQLQAGQEAVITVKMVCQLEVVKPGYFTFMFPLEFIPRYGSKDTNGGVVGEENTHMPAKFEMKMSIISTSTITNLFKSHKEIKMENNEDDTELILTIEPEESLEAKDLVLSFSTEHIREPQISLTKCEKFPGEVAAHISFIPRCSEEPTHSKELFYCFFGFLMKR